MDQTDIIEQNKTRTTTLRKKTKHKLSFDIDEKFKFKVNYINKLNCDVTKTVEVGIEAALFHGGKALCECVRTSEKIVDNDKCTWDEELTFDMSVANIPQMARLCLVVYEVSKTAKGLRTRRVKDTKQVNKYYIIILCIYQKTLFISLRNLSGIIGNVCDTYGLG